MKNNKIIALTQLKTLQICAKQGSTGQINKDIDEFYNNLKSIIENYFDTKQCPYCGSQNIRKLYTKHYVSTEGKEKVVRHHYTCIDCLKEFDAIEEKNDES